MIGPRNGITEKDLNVLAYANGFTLWHYQTPAQNPENPLPSNAFDAVATLVRPGDVIMVSNSAPGRSTAKLLVVGAIKDGAVTMASLSG